MLISLYVDAYWNYNNLIGGEKFASASLLVTYVSPKPKGIQELALMGRKRERERVIEIRSKGGLRIQRKLTLALPTALPPRPERPPRSAGGTTVD